MSLHKLLTTAQVLALDPQQPISAALRQLVALGATPELSAIRSWALKELRGYDGVPAGQLPPSRRLVSRLTGTLMNGVHTVTGTELRMTVPPNLDAGAKEALEFSAKFVPLQQSVGEIEEMLAQAKVAGSLRHVLPADLLPLISSPKFNIPCVEAYLPVTPMALAGVLDDVRTSVVEFVSAALAALPSDSTGATTAGTDGDTAVVRQVFQNCQFGATTTNVVGGSGSPRVGGIGGTGHAGAITGVAAVAAGVTREELVSELSQLRAAFAANLSSESPVSDQVDAAVAAAIGAVRSDSRDLFDSIQDVRQMIEPIWEKHVGESFRTTGQRVLTANAPKLLGLLPHLGKILT